MDDLATSVQVPRTSKRAGVAYGAWVVPVGCAVAAATILAGVLARSQGSQLGAPLAPFFASWQPSFEPAAILPSLWLLGSALFAPRLLSPRLSPPLFALICAALAAIAALSMATARGGGIETLSSVFSSDPEAANEYLPALPALKYGVAALLGNFAAWAPTLPIHPSAHPPGLLIALHWAGISSAEGLAAVVIAAGALTAPLTYLLARQLRDERGARVAALLWCFSPAAILYVATSADALFAALGTVSALALVSYRRLSPVFGAAALAVASFFSYALLAVGAWAAVVVFQRDGLRRTVVLAATAATLLIAFYGTLYAAWGFDPIGAVRAAHEVYVLGISSVRPYLYWLFGSPVAFAVAAGLPISWFVLRALAQGEPAAQGLALIVLTAALIGVTKAETERIWLFMVPLACVAAAAALPVRLLRPALVALALQTIVVQLTAATIW